MGIKERKLLVVLITAVLLVVIYYIFSWYETSVPKYNFKEGEIAQYSIRAPFSYSVLKTDLMIDNEVMAVLGQYYTPHYMISEEQKFDTLKKLDDFFIYVDGVIIRSDSVSVTTAFNDSDYHFTDEMIRYLESSEHRAELYTYLIQRISEVMSLPIIEDKDRGKVFRFSDISTGGVQFLSVVTISEAKNIILRGVRNITERAIITDLVDFYLHSNLIEDIEYLNKEKASIRKEIDPVITRVEENEYIINKDNRFTERDILKLQSLSKALQERKGEKTVWEHISTTIGRFLFNLFILGIYYYATMFFYRSRYLQFKRLVVSFSAFALLSLIASILYSSLHIQYVLMIPMPLFLLVISLLFSTNYAIMTSFFMLCILGQYVNWEMPALIGLTFSSIVCLIMLQKTKRTNYLMMFIYLMLSLGAATVITAMYQIEGIEQVLIGLFCSFINALVSVIGTLLIVPVIERRLGFATKNVLMNLLDYNHPLLKRLSKEAQGTYYHSVLVGNLAEGCAIAINANPLLARVGSYYHDIGKLEHPEYFIENVLGENIHNRLSPVESAKFIKNHVSDGVAMGRKSKLPEQVIDIIQQHHGDNRIKYFLYLAQESGESFDIADFTYNGPRPRSKEAAIVMIADVIESTVKSSADLSEETIKKIIQDSVTALLLEDQLSETSITMRELATIKKTVLPILCSIHRKRIEYPDEAK